MQSSKMELSNKPWLDQKRTITINSDYNAHSHKQAMNIRTCKLISLMQSIICMSNTQPMQQCKEIALRI